MMIGVANLAYDQREELIRLQSLFLSLLLRQVQGSAFKVSKSRRPLNARLSNSH